MTSREVKEIAYSLGAELCGIASLDRFADAPEGYHPLDVWPACRSVISFACRFPAAAVSCGSDVVYTRVRNSITAKMDAIALDLCMELEKRKAPCIPIPTNESERSVVSSKLAGVCPVRGGAGGGPDEGAAVRRLREMRGGLPGPCPGRGGAGAADVLELRLRR